MRMIVSALVAMTLVGGMALPTSAAPRERDRAKINGQKGYGYNSDANGNRTPNYLRLTCPTAETINQDSRTVLVVGIALWLPVCRRRGPPAFLLTGLLLSCGLQR